MGRPEPRRSTSARGRDRHRVDADRGPSAPRRSRASLLALVALAPALVPGRRLRVAAVALALVLGSWLAVGASLATPGRVFTRLWDGAREFYDVDLPFDPAGHSRMQGAVLLAVFASACCSPSPCRHGGRCSPSSFSRSAPAGRGRSSGEAASSRSAA